MSGAAPRSGANDEAHRVRNQLSSALFLALAVVMWATPRAARAGDEQELELARGRLDAGLYAEASARFARLLDLEAAPCPSTPELTSEGCRLSDPAIVQKARAYFAIALVAQDRRKEAAEQIEHVLRDNPQFTPSPAIYPQSVIELFYEVRAELAQELAEAARRRAEAERKRELEARTRRDANRRYLESVEELARTEAVLEHRSRWIAAIPFGVGQFHNEDVGLGIFFGATEGVLGVTSITLALLHDDLAARGLQAVSGRTAEGEICTEQCRADLRSQVDTLRIANQVSFGLLALTAVAGIVEAQVSFDGERRGTRKRTLPPRPPGLDPAVGVVAVPGAPEAFGLGLGLSF